MDGHHLKYITNLGNKFSIHKTQNWKKKKETMSGPPQIHQFFIFFELFSVGKEVQESQ